MRERVARDFWLTSTKRGYRWLSEDKSRKSEGCREKEKNEQEMVMRSKDIDLTPSRRGIGEW